uniref:Uncharacterized protein n=1 Tax=Rhizophora mucronata TaxID=61149 RepID=A0A2P2KQJ7_RHIMU
MLLVAWCFLPSPSMFTNMTRKIQDTETQNGWPKLHHRINQSSKTISKADLNNR